MFSDLCVARSDGTRRAARGRAMQDDFFVSRHNPLVPGKSSCIGDERGAWMFFSLETQ